MLRLGFSKFAKTRLDLLDYIIDSFLWNKQMY